MNPLIQSTHTTQWPIAAVAALPQKLSLLLLGIALATSLPSAMAANAERPTAASRQSQVMAQIDSVYLTLLGEIGIQTGQFGQAYSALLEAAQKSQDARLFYRAVQIAAQANAPDAAIKAAQLWAKTLPKDAKAELTQVQVWLAHKKVHDTEQALQHWIEKTPATERSALIEALAPTYKQAQQPQASLQTVQKSLQSWLHHPDTQSAAWASIGHLQLDNQDATSALESLKNALTSSPRSISATHLGMQLAKQHGAKVTQVFQTLLISQPTAVDLRLMHAKQLLVQQQNQLAQDQLQMIAQQNPQLPEPWLLLGSLLQSVNPDQAARHLQTYLELTSKLDPSDRSRQQALLSLADMAQQQNNLPQAYQWLSQITQPQADWLIPIQLQKAQILAQQHRIDEARAIIQSIVPNTSFTPQAQRMAEVDVLKKASAWADIETLLANTDPSNPSDTDLVYERAMAAEQRGQYEQMESLLKELISLQPQFFHASNALGYVLADRNIRLTEALHYIEQAYAIAPNDAAIIDSLGWVKFRLKQLPQAIELLQQAYAKQPDAEVASHLAEALWANQQPDAAIQILQKAQQLDPQHPILKKTIQRLQIQMP